MTDVLFEQRIVQNTALAAETLWHAVNEGHAATGRVSGIPLPLVFLVLPMTFHQRTAQAIATKNMQGAIFKALAEDREITLGLQSRMQAMAPRTFEALALGFRTGLLELDRTPQRCLMPGRRSAPVSHIQDEVKTTLAAAKRVGHALTELSPVQIASHLGIQY